MVCDRVLSGSRATRRMRAATTSVRKCRDPSSGAVPSKRNPRGRRRVRRIASLRHLGEGPSRKWGRRWCVAQFGEPGSGPRQRRQLKSRARGRLYIARNSSTPNRCISHPWSISGATMITAMGLSDRGVQRQGRLGQRCPQFLHSHQRRKRCNRRLFLFRALS